MTATSAMIAYISPYTVSDSGNFTTAKFNHLSAVAKNILDGEDPGLSSTLYDHAHALLICHLYESGNLGQGALTSERIGDYGYSKEAGETSFLIRYRGILAKASAGQSAEDLEEQERTDHAMSAMQLDQSTIPKYTSEEEDTE